MINPSGGLISRGHPLGATGKQIRELLVKIQALKIFRGTCMLRGLSEGLLRFCRVKLSSADSAAMKEHVVSFV